MGDLQLPDYYAILGVTPEADESQIRAEYLARARHLHPDTMGSGMAADEIARATAKMARLNEAWQVLSDPERKRAYDASRSQAASAGLGGIARSFGRVVGSRSGRPAWARSAGNFIGRIYDEFDKGRRGTN